jgi:hypothetical protein
MYNGQSIREIISIVKKYYLEGQIEKIRDEERSFSKKKQETYFNLIKKVFPRCPIANWTDIDNYTSYEFHVLLNEDVNSLMDDDVNLIKYLGGTREDLHIFISYLVDCWCCYSVQTFFNNGIWNFNTSYKAPEKFIVNIHNLENELNNLGYLKLSEGDVKQIIQGIDLENVEEKKTTLFNLLFSDIVDLLK